MRHFQGKGNCLLLHIVLCGGECYDYSNKIFMVHRNIITYVLGQIDVF